MDNAAKIPEWAVKKTAGNLPMLFELDDVVCLIVSTREAALREAAENCPGRPGRGDPIECHEDYCGCDERILALIERDPC